MSSVNKTIKLFSIIIAPLLLTSCGGVSLREDIAAFIKNFSIQNAREAVKKGHYLSKMTGSNDKLTPVSEDEEIIFDATTPNVATMSYHYERTVGNKVVKDDYQIIYENSKHFYVTNDSKKEISYEEAYADTKRFFFSDSIEQTSYHYGGAYYGDIIKESAAKQQNFVTIKDGIYNYHVDGLAEGSAVLKIDYKANTLGMLISLTDSGYDTENPDLYFTQNITVTY